MPTNSGAARDENPQASSPQEADATEALKSIARHLNERAFTAAGELSPDARFQMAIRQAPDRRNLLEQLIVEICPNGVDAAAWSKWLRGGKSPFPERPLKKVGLATEWPSATLLRTTPRVTKQEKKIERLREELEAEERHLAYLKAHDNAALHWLIVDQLIGIMAPAFAMGPAWTIMRALSAHLPDEEAKHLTRHALDEHERQRAIEEYRDLRKKETDAMLAVLDHFSGHPGFERALRAALQNVVKQFEPRRDEWTRSGRRPRSKSAMWETAHPEAQEDRGSVLDGLAQHPGPSSTDGY